MFREYTSKDDFVLYTLIKDEIYFPLVFGMFAIFFPEEVYRPGLNIEGRQKVRKVVIKIKIPFN